MLLWENDSTINKKEAEDQLSFRCVIGRGLRVRADDQRAPCRGGSSEGQPAPHAWPPPVALSRQGQDYDKEVDGNLHQVFVTFSERAGQMIAERNIMVNY